MLMCSFQMSVDFTNSSGLEWKAVHLDDRVGTAQLALSCQQICLESL